jgi:hypothetical protein
MLVSYFKNPTLPCRHSLIYTALQLPNNIILFKNIKYILHLSDFDTDLISSLTVNTSHQLIYSALGLNT